MKFGKYPGEKLTRFSIRKYHFGAASVAVASLLFFGNGTVQAAENASAATDGTHQTVAGGGGDSSGDSGSTGNPNNTATTTNPTSEEATSKEAKKANVTEEAKKVNVTDLKTALEELESKVASITDEAKKAKLNSVIAEAKKVLADENATQEQIDSQVTLVKDAVKSVPEVAEKVDETKPSEEDRSATAESSNREKPTPARSARGRRGRPTDVQPADSESTTLNEEAGTANKETVPKQLPTYTNGAENYKLAEEIGNIIVYMRKNGASEDAIAPIKSKYDALNEKLGLADEDGVLSAEDFATATANLTAARDAVEKFMEGKVVVPSRPSLKPKALNRTERAAERASGKGIETTDYASKTGYFFESGQNNSPYAKYSYVFYSKGVVASAYYEGGDIPEAYKKFHITARPTDTGIAWKIVVNENHETLDANKVYFTLPERHNVKAGSVTVQAFNKDGRSVIERPSVSSGDQIVEALSKAFTNIPDWHALHGAGLKNVRKGTKDNTNAVPMTTSSASNTGAKNFKVNTLHLLGRESTQAIAGLTDRGFYNRNVAIETDKNMQRYSDEKFAKISEKVRDVYTFELGPQDERSYVISFETTGSNDMKNLTYAGGLKYVKRI